MSLTIPQLLALKLQAQNQQSQQSPDQWGQNLNTTAAMNAMQQAQAQGQYGGLADAGNSLANALMLQNLRAQNSPAAQAMVARGQVSDPSQAASVLSPSPFSQAGNWLSNLFGFGGGQ